MVPADERHQRKGNKMKLTYWVAENLDDSQCYNIRAKTKKEVLNKITLVSKEWENETDLVAPKYGPVHKVEVEYADAFDLMDACMGEGSVSEG
jgi:hypothetical protein